jgi:glycosyltransferase involved in cell wall biosynthesis
LSINNYYYRRGGSDAVFIDHDQIFSSNNWDTALFSMRHPKNLSTHWSDYFVDELEFGNTYGLSQKIVMASKVIYSFEARKKLSQLLNVFFPDIAHIHCVYHHISPSILSLLHSKSIPCVMTAHDLKIACPAYKMLNSNGVCEKCKNGNFLNLIKNRCIHESLPISTLVALESAFHKLSGLYRNNLDMIVTPSIFFRDKLIEWGWQENKLAYIPNFIDCNEIVPHYDAGKYFLYFGRLAPEKGVDTLIKAAIKANVALKIAGTGQFEQYLKNIAPNNEKIEFVGYKSGDDLWSLIKNSRVVVLPSEWYENAPISILEAYAAGKPVIGANIGGIPEMLQIGITGFLFESGNTSDLTDKLLKVKNYSDKKVSSLGNNARDYVSNTFNTERYFSSITSLYHSLGVRQI